jgi:large subunit ribosomal protein L17
MRHGDKINNLGRTASHRRALLANLAISLIEHKRITTTLAKARSLRQYIEPLVTKAKDNTTHSRRVVFSYLQNKDAVKELFSTIADKISERPGGYVRVIKLGFRRGDGADTAMIEFVDFNEVYNPNAGKVRNAKKTRRGGARKVAEPAAIVAEPVAPAVEEVAEVEETMVEPIEETVAAVETAAEETVNTVEETVETATDDVVADAPEAPAADEKKEDETAA